MRFGLKWRTENRGLTTRSECGTPTAEGRRFVSVRDLLSLSAAAGNAVASGFIAGQQGASSQTYWNNGQTTV